MQIEDPEQLAQRIGLTPSTLESRQNSLGITREDRRVLKEAFTAIQGGVDGFIDRLYAHFAQFEELNVLLGNASQIERLKIQQKKYLSELFESEMDWSYAISRVKIGAIHHKVGLTPQWFISTYAHFVAEHVPQILKASTSPEAGLRQVLALIKSVFLDATIILDSYGMTEELSLRSANIRSKELQDNDGSLNDIAAEAKHAESTSRPITKVQLTSSTVSERKSYVGLSDKVAQTIHELKPSCQEVLPSLLKDFYDFFSTQPETSALVPVDSIPRLKRQLESYWNEFFTSEFDRPYAASRMMVGLVHDRIGLPLQWYLIGLSHQIESLFKSSVFVGSDAARCLDAFIRALFFDVAYVIDSYMEARTKRVLKNEGYAAQLIAGLTSAVAVVDGERRVVSVNQKLVSYLRIDASLVYQAPIDQVITIQGLGDLIDKVGGGGSFRKQRQSIIAKIAGKVCRVTAIALDPWEDVKGTPVAVIIDDISDIMKAAVEMEESDSHLASIINAAELTVWELDIPTWTIELVSAPVLELTGYRDVYFVGRPNAWLNCIPETDCEKFKAYCQTAPASRKVSFEHKMIRADGQEVWARTFVKHSTGLKRNERVFGVTIDITSEKYKEKHGDVLASALKREMTKSQVLTSMSHEIRTPLNGVIGMLSFLLGGTLDGSVNQHISSAHQSALDLLSLLNDILDMSKLEAGRMEVHPSQFDLVSLIESVEGLFKIQVKEKGLEFHRKMDAHLSSCWFGDASKIRQILLNLLSNAVKFTEKGSIGLTISQHTNGLKFSLQDSGIGIPESKASTIFQPFVQAHSSMGGTGLGLAICKQLAELMGGILSYSKISTGGSLFDLFLPLKPVDPEALPEGKGRCVAFALESPILKSLEQKILGAGWSVVDPADSKASILFVDKIEKMKKTSKDAIIVLCGATKPELPSDLSYKTVFALGVLPLNTKTLIEILSSGTKRTTEGRSFKGRVLVAEDNVVNQRVISLMLERLGFDVDIVINGALAVDAAKQRSYELVFMDMLMPEMDGIQASTRIRSQGKNAKTPIIALTANAEEADRSRCIAAGMNEVLIKPLQMASLREAISHFLPA